MYKHNIFFANISAHLKCKKGPCVSLKRQELIELVQKYGISSRRNTRNESKNINYFKIDKPGFKLFTLRRTALETSKTFLNFE